MHSPHHFSRKSFLSLGLASVLALPIVPQLSQAQNSIVADGFTSHKCLGTNVRFEIFAPQSVQGSIPIISLHGLGDNAHRQMRPSYQHAILQACKYHHKNISFITVDGGRSYFHPRQTGEDRAAMIIDELLPLLSQKYHINTAHIGMHGISMGGYGALRIGGLLGAHTCPAIAVASPAMWLSPGASAPGAFDNAEDFERYTLIQKEQQFHGTHIAIDISDTDPFYQAVQVFIKNLPLTPTIGYGSGGHSWQYWDGKAGHEIDFLARYL